AGEAMKSGLGWSRVLFFFFSSRRRHTRSYGDWSSDVCSSDLQMRSPVWIRLRPVLKRFFHISRVFAGIRLPVSLPEALKTPKTGLLYFDRRARFGELLLDGLGFFLVHALFDRLGGSVDQVLGFFQAQAGDFAHDFDHVDLVRARCRQDDAELGL